MKMGTFFENQKKFPFSDLRGIGTLRYFTLARRKNAGGAPTGVTVALAWNAGKPLMQKK